VVFCALRDEDTGGPLVGVDYVVTNGGGQVVAKGHTKAPQALVEHRVDHSGSYTVQVVGAGFAVFPAPTGEPLADGKVDAVELKKKKNPAEVKLSLGIQPTFTFHNHDGYPVKNRSVYLVPAEGEIVSAPTNDDGRAELRILKDAPTFDCFSSKKLIGGELLGEDIAKVTEGQLAAFLDGKATDCKPAEAMKLSMLHRSRIERALFPHAAKIVPIASKGMTVDQATCNFAAGIVQAILTGLGYKAAKLNDTSIHVSNRVTPGGGGELRVDATMPQFMTNGTDVDRELKAKGGWIGTDDELEAFCEDHVGDNNCHQAPDTPWPMAWAELLVRMRCNAQAYLAQDGAPERAVVEAHLGRLTAELAEALFFEERFEVPSDDVYGYVSSNGDNFARDRWEKKVAQAKQQATADTAPLEAKDDIGDLREQAHQMWRDEGVKAMRGLWRRSDQLGLNGQAADALATNYKAWEGGGGAAKPAYPAIKQAIDRER
jgi:hypothetical protein